MTALEETEYIRTALRDFAKLIAAGIKHLFFFLQGKRFHFQYRVNYLVYLVF